MNRDLVHLSLVSTAAFPAFLIACISWVCRPLPHTLPLHMQLGDLHVDIKKITDKFFAPGPIANFLEAFVRGEGALPVTTGPIRGLPRAWRRNYGKPSESRPSLLFLDLPDPTAPDSATRNLAAGSILELVKENNRYHIPVFGVSGRQHRTCAL